MIEYVLYTIVTFNSGVSEKQIYQFYDTKAECLNTASYIRNVELDTAAGIENIIAIDAYCEEIK